MKCFEMKTITNLKKNKRRLHYKHIKFSNPGLPLLWEHFSLNFDYSLSAKRVLKTCRNEMMYNTYVLMSAGSR